MGFLGVLRLGGILARGGRQVARAEGVLHVVADIGDRLARHLHAVGPHVGDEADRLALDVDAFVQLLRRPHRLLGAEAELAAGLLLEGAGGEGGGRVALDPPLLDRNHGEIAGLDRCLGAHGAGFVGQVELVELAAIEMGQPGAEGGTLGRLEAALDGPVFPGAEGLDLGLALADQAQRDRLHPAGRAAARQLAPQHRREGEAHQVVQRPPRQIGIDQRGIEVARMGDGVLHRPLGDLVEGDPADLHPLQGAAPGQHLLDMPGNRLALAIRIGCQEQPAGALQGPGDLGDLAFAAVLRFPVHGEILVRADRAILRRQVTHMAEAREHLVVPAKVLVDGLGLGRGFDDDDVRHGHRIRWPIAAGKEW